MPPAMKILAIDTSGPDCAAAIYDDQTGAVIASRQETIGKGHAERLMAMIDDVTADAGIDIADVDGIGVVIGPGSFTGIRVGVSVARGFGVALSVPLFGVSSLETLAFGVVKEGSSQPIMAVIDAKRDQVYVQQFHPDGASAGDPAVMSVEDARTFCNENQAMVVGSGAALLRAEDTGPVSADRLPIGDVAVLASRKAPGKPAPLYLRGPDAKPQAGFAVARK